MGTADCHAAANQPYVRSMDIDLARPVDTERLARDEGRVQARFWDKVRATLGRVPFVEDAVAAYFCTRDPQTPARAKAVLLGALAYFVMPADMVPDFVAYLGFTDDAAVLAAAVRSVAPHVTEAHRARARSALAAETGAEAEAGARAGDEGAP